MEILSLLGDGFQVALSPINILWVTFGGILGTILGMIPGLGPVTGVAVLIPMTFGMDPNAALITMCGVYYGAMYGGSRSSILINTPGDGAAVAATFDGYPMAQNGRAESALAISAIASFIGGLLATILMIVIATPVSRLALKFGPPEYFMLMIFALSATVTLSKGNIINGFISIVFGLMLSTVGMDSLSGVKRFTFGIMELQSGIDFIVVIIAVFALGEVLKSFNLINQDQLKVRKDFGKIWISKQEWKETIWPILRSSPLGFFIGALPGAGATMASLLAYSNEKSLSKDPDSFGKGNIVGLAAPESANNAASVGALIPMLTLGIPGSGTTAVMMGALMMLGLQPGPTLFTTQADLVWGIMASMIIGNVILAIVNIPLAGVLVRILSVPQKILYPVILGLTFIGTYSIGYSTVDLYLLLIFGVIGFFMSKGGIPTAPMILAIIVGYSMEQSFRQALMVSQGQYGIFFDSTVCKVLIICTLVSFLMPFKDSFLKNRSIMEMISGKRKKA
jgi:putative tricarboxylic transport membrane protein